MELLLPPIRFGGGAGGGFLARSGEAFTGDRLVGVGVAAMTGEVLPLEV